MEAFVGKSELSKGKVDFGRLPFFQTDVSENRNSAPSGLELALMVSVSALAAPISSSLLWVGRRIVVFCVCMVVRGTLDGLRVSTSVFTSGTHFE
ncbi:hypothetical protein ACLOJK_001657 [Asimina triloba]